MNKILVTGGAGFLGSILCRELLDDGYKVRVLDNLIYGDEGIKDLYGRNNFEFINGNMTDVCDVLSAMDDVDAIIHLGALVGDNASDVNAEDTIEINYLATKMLAGVCKYKKINKFIFASSASVYGISDEQGLLTEESRLNPLSLYARMKEKSEKALLEMKDYVFQPTILRMGTLYGLSPRMRFDIVINLFSIMAIKNHKISLHGGNQERCFCHVKDAAQAYIRCLKAPTNKINGQIFNVSSENMRIGKLAELIKIIIPNTQIDTYTKKFDNRSYIASSRKIERVLGFTPKYKIMDGIREIKECAVNGMWDNYEDPIYDNYKYLKKRA